MTRQESLLGLHQTLLARRKELSKLLADELAYLHDFKAADATGDSADLALRNPHRGEWRPQPLDERVCNALGKFVGTGAQRIDITGIHV